MGRKKKKEALSGAEIYAIVMDDGYVCNNCEVEMDFDQEDPEYVICPNCGSRTNVYDYEYMWDNEEAFDLYNGGDGEGIPAGCAACGGPYPSCKTSCSMFDD